jgi:bisphosphoglycerate-dependent phosphoglycerate mutase
MKDITTISLIYEGESKDNTKKYYTKDNLQKSQNIIIKNNIKENSKYIFYIVRHGMGTHNLPTSLHVEYNTQLTPEGIQQATRAGLFFEDYLRTTNQKIDHYFTSDLQRTRQTLSHILKAFYPIKNNSKNKYNNILIATILPCSNEVHVELNGKCNNGNLLINGWENYPRCTLENISDPNSECNNIKMQNFIISFNWRIYLNFYNKTMRTIRSQECNDKNMILCAINFINEPLNLLTLNNPKNLTSRL